LFLEPLDILLKMMDQFLFNDLFGSSTVI